MPKLDDIVGKKVKDVIVEQDDKGHYSKFVLYSNRVILHLFSEKGGSGYFLYTVKEMQQMLKEDGVIPADVETFKKIIEFYRPKKESKIKN